MERHKCKLCSRSFSNGRALGGHMKAHMANTSHSLSTSFSWSEEEKSVFYTLRENPKKSSKVAEDRESETESKNPTRQRSNNSSEEHVAMCLIMLSRDTWNAPPPKTSRTRSNHLFLTCNKPFRSSRSLAAHTNICTTNVNSNNKLFECPFCYKVFASGQALGGHKRSHLLPSSSSTSLRFKHAFIDLNLPAPIEDDNLSVLSDA
ncbi:hypothetical protein Fmac_025946 [Flemingia macrophylla]|uniref:C2H2-type domain-containing protein n=1 Tax=Flemingia macrophylla TaxID=520843 RepID=A0ABD1LDG9_9FABA